LDFGARSKLIGKCIHLHGPFLNDDIVTFKRHVLSSPLPFALSFCGCLIFLHLMSGSFPTGSHLLS
jgi:hypothetical protein